MCDNWHAHATASLHHARTLSDGPRGGARAGRCMQLDKACKQQKHAVTAYSIHGIDCLFCLWFCYG